jgi:hypothetical protein
MAENRGKWITYKRNEDAAGLTTGERDMSLQYQSPATTSGLKEEVENIGINLAQYNSGGVMKETPKGKSAAEYDTKKLLQYLIKENKDQKDSIQEEIKDLRDLCNLQLKNKLNKKFVKWCLG